MQEVLIQILIIAIKEVHLDIIQAPIQITVLLIEVLLLLLRFLHLLVLEAVLVEDPLVVGLLVVAAKVAVNNK